MKNTTKTEFHLVLRALESLYNAGTTTRYNKDKNITEWFIGRHPVGVSGGVVGDSTFYSLLEVL